MVPPARDVFTDHHRWQAGRHLGAVSERETRGRQVAADGQTALNVARFGLTLP
jgi:hypothetical protein